MGRDQIRALLRIKSVIDQLRKMDQRTLTVTEREAWNDTLAQAYDRAAYVLQAERGDTNDATTYTGHRFCCYST